MGLGTPYFGPNNVDVYRMAKDPWVTSSIATANANRITFDSKVTGQIMLHNTGSSDTIRMGFTENGVNGNNYVELGPNDSLTLDVRISELWLKALGGSAPYQLFAGLTVVKSQNFWTITGSTNNTKETGWGGVG
jgi:hypothetical protein